MAAGSRLDQPGRASTEVTGVKGEGYGSNRSREGPHTSSPRRRPAERGRRRAGAPRLARSKGPARQPHDDARGQVATSTPPRSRPPGLISAEPGCGIRLPTMDGGRPTTRLRLRDRSRASNPKENPAEGGAQVLGRTNSEGRRARSTRTNARPRERFRSSIKNF